NDLTEIAESIKSSPFIIQNEVIEDVVIVGTSLDKLRIKFVSATPNITITPPDCTQLGFNQTYLGISFADSQELSWLIAGVLISAFAIKVLKRGL
ncbi:MAG: hypothetical protein HAW67_04735, partial [Endozoicomonadaceae bacterium]|nr:hypothetical protein [Endozoicomonadaceae bacterium]